MYETASVETATSRKYHPCTFHSDAMGSNVGSACNCSNIGIDQPLRLIANRILFLLYGFTSELKELQVKSKPCGG